MPGRGSPSLRADTFASVRATLFGALACVMLAALAGHGGAPAGPGQAAALEPPPLRSADVPLRIWTEYMEARNIRAQRPREAVERMQSLFERVDAETHPRGKCLLGLNAAREVYRQFARHTEAQRLLKQVREVADESGFTLLRGHVRVALAELFVAAGRLRDARRLLDEALELDGIGDDVRASATVWKGTVLFELGEPEAMRVLERGRDLASEAGELESAVRYVLTLAHHFERENRSLGQIERLFQIGRRLIPDRRFDLENRMHGELWLAQSQVYWRRFEREKAVDALEQADEWFRRTTSYANRLRIWMTKAELMLDVGGYEEAHEICVDAQEYLARNDMREPGLQARLALLQAEAARGRGDFEQASEILGAAYELLGEQGTPRLRARLYRFESRVLRGQAQVQNALERLQRAHAVYAEVGDVDGEIAVQHAIGEIYWQLGNEARATRTLHEALALARRSGNVRQLARVLTAVGRATGDERMLVEAAEHAEELGDERQRGWAKLTLAQLQHEQGRLDEAESAVTVAIRCARDRYAPLGVESRLQRTRLLLRRHAKQLAEGEEQRAAEHLARADAWARDALEVARPTRDATLIMQVHAMYGRILRLKGNPEDALRFFAEAAADLEHARRSLDSTDTRATLYAQNRFVFSNLIDLATELGREAEALQWSETSKARAFLDMLAEAEANVRTGIDPELLSEERALLSELSAVQETRMSLLELGEDAQNRLAALESEARALEQRFDELKERIRRASPAYHALHYPEPATLEEIQAHLGDRQMLLAYSLGETRSHLFAVTPEGLHWEALPGEAFIARLVRYQRDLMISGSPLVLEELARHSAALGRLLLGDVAELLQHYPEVVIAPDGILHYLPFEALAVNEPAEPPQTFADLPYLVLSLDEVVYVPSSTVFVELQRRTQREERNEGEADPFLLALGDPVFAGETDGGDVDPAASETALFPRLPFTKPEVEEIHALAESKHPGANELLVREAATEEALKENVASARYVHLATHGVLDEVAPSTSGLALADPQRFGEGNEDGFLYLAEIFNLELSAELVVLSACQTGLGRMVTGEGVEGMTRAFLYAGAPRVVVSLWAVDDDSTARLMPRFYEAYWAGEQQARPARALVEAKRDLIERETHAAPMFWAPFVATGAR